MNNNLIKLRKEKNVTQQELANLLGISEEKYIKKETNEINFYGDEMFHIARYFNKNISEIFNKEIILSAEELKELGGQLSDIMTILESWNISNDSLNFLKKYDSEAYHLMVKRFLSNQYEQVEKLLTKIDTISFKLQVCDDEKELRG